jgi:large subunit ribosomal protein L20
MPRSVNSVASKERKKKVLKHAKGFFGRRKNVWTVAKNAVDKAWEYAYTGRKLKKRDFRTLWIARINAAVRPYDLSYSKFIDMLNKAEISINRKTLADLALNNPEAYKAIVDKVKN